MCTTVAIAIVAETCSPFTVLPALINEYRVPELNVQNGVLKSLSFLFEYIGEMGKDYIYAVTPLLEDALMDRYVNIDIFILNIILQCILNFLETMMNNFLKEKQFFLIFVKFQDNAQKRYKKRYCSRCLMIIFVNFCLFNFWSTIFVSKSYVLRSGSVVAYTPHPQSEYASFESHSNTLSKQHNSPFDSVNCKIAWMWNEWL